MEYVIVESPIGPLMLAGEGDVLHVLAFQSGSRARGPASVDAGAERLCRRARGTGPLLRRHAPRVPVAGGAGGDPFQQRVWDELRGIPYGETISYLELASADRQPEGRACGRPRQRRQPPADHRALPPRDRVERQR
jgi:methylated-DNA-[protein]-cysteine S-methyltransferase